MNVDPKQIERELDEMENGIMLLKREFEIFFGGGSRTPPIDNRNKLDKSVKRYFGKEGLSYAQRYRYTSILSRFNSYVELWNKQLKLKEEGRPITGVQVPTSATAAPKAASKSQKKDPMESVFQDYLKSREKTGEGNPNLDYDKFTRLLKTQRDQLINKYHCKEVEFYVSLEEGKTKLKARPLK